MAKLCDYNKHNNKILSVTFQMTTPNEVGIYLKLLESEGPLRCSHCATELDRVTEGSMFITVPNPTSATGLGFATGNPHIICPKCGNKVDLSMVDISPFAEVATFVTQLKQQEERTAKDRGSKKR